MLNTKQILKESNKVKNFKIIKNHKKLKLLTSFKHILIWWEYYETVKGVYVYQTLNLNQTVIISK